MPRIPVRDFTLYNADQEFIEDELNGFDPLGLVQGTRFDDTIFGVPRGVTRASRSIPGVRAQLIGINGLGGDDFIRGDGFYGVYIAGGSGSDVLHGGSSHDVIDVSGPTSTFSKNSAIDAVQHRNKVKGKGGGDRIFTGRGRDTVYGGSGDDHIVPGFGRTTKTLEISTAPDTLYGNDDEDRIVGNAGRDRIIGGTGHDLLVGGLGTDNITGGQDNDTIYGDFIDIPVQKQRFYTPVVWDAAYEAYYEQNKDRGNGDVLRGQDGHDLLYGGKGADLLFGGNDEDDLYGGTENDVLDGGAGFINRVYGEDGEDTIHVGKHFNESEEANEKSSYDVVDAGDGNDMINITTRLDPGGAVRETKDGLTGRYHQPDRAHRIKGGTGMDTFRILANRSERNYRAYGNRQSVRITDFEPGVDKPIVFEYGSPIDFTTRNYLGDTQVYFRQGTKFSTQPAGANIGIYQNVENLLLTIEGHTDININNRDFFDI